MDRIKACLGKKKPDDGLLSELEAEGKMAPTKSHTRVVRTLLPYLWPAGEWLVRASVLVAIVLMLFGKLCTVATPLAYKQAVDILTADSDAISDQYYLASLVNSTVVAVDSAITQYTPLEASLDAKIVFPVGWILLYGLLRFLASSSNDLRDSVFVRVTQHALRTTALETFQHLHGLSIKYHLHRQTGGVLRAIERGTQGVSFLLTFVLFNIGPTMLEICMVVVVLLYLYEIWFGLITFVTMALYIGFTLGITQWRIKFRRSMNDLNNTANNKAVDSLINYETVKYFGNEEHEASRYGAALMGYNKGSLALLNMAQAITIALGVTAVMLLAAYEVTKGTMTVGDFVLVNTYMLQLYIPLGFLGTSYRMIKQSLVDLENMFSILDETPDVQNAENSRPLMVDSGRISFEHVSFSYGEAVTFSDVTFEVPPGHTVAIVGPTGAGKSTIFRLLFRFYDVLSGSIKIDGQDIRDVTQHSLRSNIGVVPQDTVLFNDSILYNIRYGRLDASDEEVAQAARMAQIHDFITGLPDGYDTEVGERGLRLSGGEKQRVAIARAILKNPPILIFDEATSALDSRTEKEIVAQLNEAAKGRSTLVIAHRLSTVQSADQILVIKDGGICERGSFNELLALNGEFKDMWDRQQDNSSPAIAEAPTTEEL